MLLEHWIYAIAIAMIVGMEYYKYTGRDHSWIIIASAYAPDLDAFTNTFLNKLGITLLVYGQQIQHGDFHNIVAMVLFALVLALILQALNIKFRDTFIFAFIGFGAHMVEDALVYNPAYSFLWPVFDQKLGIGILDGTRDLFEIANTEVLILGVILVLLCAYMRTVYEGNDWINRMIIPKYFLKLNGLKWVRKHMEDSG